MKLRLIYSNYNPVATCAKPMAHVNVSALLWAKYTLQNLLIPLFPYSVFYCVPILNKETDDSFENNVTIHNSSITTTLVLDMQLLQHQRVCLRMHTDNIMHSNCKIIQNNSDAPTQNRYRYLKGVTK